MKMKLLFIKDSIWQITSMLKILPWKVIFISWLCLVVESYPIASFRSNLQLSGQRSGSTSSSSISSTNAMTKTPDSSKVDNADDISSRRLLIHWKGEKEAGYSKPFRHLEFRSALEAELNINRAQCHQHPPIHFVNALNYAGHEFMPDVNIEHFNEAMQYIIFTSTNDENMTISRNAIIRAAQRCSLIHALYEVIASSDTLDKLAKLAIDDGGFSDLYKGSDSNNTNSTWCFRARNYGDDVVHNNVANDDGEEAGDSNIVGRVKRYSSRARSMGMEREGLEALADLLIRFGGKVDLLNPQVKVYLFDGLKEESGMPRKVLARRIASGPKTSSIAPAQRICITNTPLEPIAAFSLCNVARIRGGDRILDPYAGSCATLLAASMIAPQLQTVGIDIAHNGLVNRADILEDFSSRHLTPPNELICGDSTDPSVRNQAKAAVDNNPFDAIIADPPYGIRESMNYNEKSPLEEVFVSIATDRDNGSRLLKVGGRLVAFVPVTDEQTLEEVLPNEELTCKAGLRFELSKEQPLNEKLSRFLVSYICSR